MTSEVGKKFNGKANELEESMKICGMIGDISIIEDQQLLFDYEKLIKKEKITNEVTSEYPFNSITELAKIAKGDSIEFLKKLSSKSADLILTDPPYNLGNFMHKRNTNLDKMRENHFAYAGWDNLDEEDWVKNMDLFFKQSNRILKKKGTLLMFMSLMKVETIIKLAIKNKFYYKTVGVWHKTNPMPRNMNLQFVNSTECWIYFINEGTTGTFNNNGKVIHDFFETSLTTGSEKRLGKHPTQKPIKILNHFINLLSNEGDLVIDPFMGSGSTGVSAEINKRKFIGIELEEKYYSLAKNRIQDISNESN